MYDCCTVVYFESGIVANNGRLYGVEFMYTSEGLYNNDTKEEH